MRLPAVILHPGAHGRLDRELLGRLDLQGDTIGINALASRALAFRFNDG